MIIVRSHIAYGAPKAVDTAKSHGSPLGEEEVAATKQALGWDPDKHFYVPDEVYEHMNGVERGNELETEWNDDLRALVGGVPGRPREVGRGVGRAHRLVGRCRSSRRARRSRRATPARR